MKSMEMKAAITRHVKRAGELFFDGCTAEVHSVFRNTVNLWVDGYLFSLQNDALPLSPIGMGVRLDEEGFACLPIQRGQAASFSQDRLTLGSVLFTRNPGGERDPQLTERFHAGLRNAAFIKGTIAEFIKENADRCGFQNAVLLSEGDDSSRLTPGARTFYFIIKQAREHAALGQYAQGGQIAARMIGLGPGLTPSGDDFLMGLLSVLWYLENDQPAGKMRKATVTETEKNIKNTNDISAALLLRACCGEFADVFPPLYRAVSSAEAKNAVDAVGKMGHSSGVDTLSGIYLGLSILGQSID